MNPKRSLILASISVLVLMMILVSFKWPLNIAFGRHSQEVKAEEKTPAVLNTTITTNNRAEPKMIKFPEEGIPVLMYHSIHTIPGNSLGVPVKQFSEELEWLRHQHYHALSLEEFYQALAEKAPIPDKPILFTFDDGYSDNYTEAWPILRQNGFKATFFIITNSVGAGMMNWDQLNDLSHAGNSIGSHTVHHLDLTKLSYKQQESELTISKQELEHHLGISVQAICFPSGQYNQTTLQLLSKLEYRLGFTTHSGKVHFGDNPMILKRVRISGGMPIASFQKSFP